MQRRLRTLSQVAAATIGAALPAQASEGGLVLIPDWPLVIALLVGFLILILPLNRLIFQPLFGVLDQREKRIQGAQHRAADLNAQAGELLARYQREVDEVQAEAEQARRAERDAARAERLRIASEARDEAVQRIERSREELATARADAREILRRGTDDLAREIAGQVLGRSIS